MPRDYKHRVNRGKKQPGIRGPLWMLGGVVLGVLLTTIGFWLLPALLERVRLALPELPEVAEPRHPAEGAAEDSERPEVPRPRFDFYTILPEMELVVPERDIAGEVRKGVRQVERPGTYLLQTGSFREEAQADRLKARLALLGLDVSVQEVRINNDQTWYRVRVGPYSKLETLNRDRVRLRENGIEAILLRVK